MAERSDRKPMTARYPGVCRDCGKPFAAGDPIYWAPGVGVGAAHPDCHMAMLVGGQPKRDGGSGMAAALKADAARQAENQRLLDEHWAVHRADDAAGRPTRAGVWAEMLVLAKRLGDEATAQVAAEEMRRAVDRQTTR